MDKNTGDMRATAIQDETLRIEEDAEHSAKGHFAAADRWKSVHLWLGIPAAIGAGIAGVTAFQNLAVVSGIVSFLVAAITSVITFLNPSERADTHVRAGNAYLALRNQTRIFRTIQLSGSKDKDAERRLAALAEKRDELNASSVKVPKWAYRKAKKRIERGETTYKVGDGRN